jgi:hypothetical protein
MVDIIFRRTCPPSELNPEGRGRLCGVQAKEIYESYQRLTGDIVTGDTGVAFRTLTGAYKRPGHS